MERHSIPGVDDGQLLVPSGPIRKLRAESFRVALEGAVPECRHIVLDFSQVTFLESAAIGTLLKTSDQLRSKGGALILCAMSPAVRAVIDSIGMTGFFTIVHSREEAEVALQEGSDFGRMSSGSGSDLGIG